MISVSVIPQTLCYAGIGRSSDFVLLAARLPGIRVFQWPVPIYIIYTRCMYCPKNGLTASGNVADSHCIPILALGSHNPQEPNAGTKVRISERFSKFASKREQKKFTFYAERKQIELKLNIFEKI